MEDLPSWDKRIPKNGSLGIHWKQGNLKKLLASEEVIVRDNILTSTKHPEADEYGWHFCSRDEQPVAREA